MITFFVCFISVKDSEEFIRGSHWTPTCSAQFVKEDFLGETICCVITGMFTEEAGEQEKAKVEEEAAEEEDTQEQAEEKEGKAEEEEVRRNLSIGNPFSFVTRSRQTLQD